MTISVIIPVYNTEAYIPACIDSILSQSFSDFEVLLIDDGSTDGSGAICDEYAKIDSRIRVFHKENGGVSSARNEGLDNAKGDWVFFIDSDDLLPNRALEVLMAHADSDVDVVYGGIRKFNDYNDDIETILVDHEGIITIDDALDAFIVPEKRVKDWQRYMINRIYRMSIINKFKLRFNINIYYKEDGLFVAQYLCRCSQKAVCLSDIVYLYRQIDSGAMGGLESSFNARLLTNIDSHGFILKELKKRGVRKDLIEREGQEIIKNYYWIASVMKRSGNLTRYNEYLLFKKIIKNAGIRASFRDLVSPRFSRFLKRCLS